MPTKTAPQPVAGAFAVPPVPPGLDTVFGRFWPEPPRLAGHRVVAACALVGVLAAATMTFTRPGLSWALVLLGAGSAAYVTARHRRNTFTIGCTALASLLGLPWFGRALRVVGSGGRIPAVVRTVVVSFIALAVFGALFASADAVFATWIDALVPSLSFNDLVTRIFLGCLVFGLTLAAAYLALNPSQVETERRPVDALGNRFEWLVPVLLVDAVFLLFLAAQASVVFGGHDYVKDTTGLTYADYVHQGFGQLTLATILTLFVVWAGARKVKDAPADRLWMRVSLGLLCLLTLVVVASALHRLQASCRPRGPVRAGHRGVRSQAHAVG